uniref:ATP synthase F0 subunit 8 n=1 Tax=Puliciphora borinquenensis TaxID=92546 RepID=UPI001D10EE72|nr:ATP synthase F0 subunit 8 [Puliciphora borinquenensis]QZL38253.1 ATP synthase F0 subunit 8 [Puliciphora borinquenensis]
MPQMAPLAWFSLFMIFSIMFVFFNILNYFNIFYTPLTKSIMGQKKMTMNWKW